jgi:hypothetical protein
MLQFLGGILDMIVMNDHMGHRWLDAHMEYTLIVSLQSNKEHMDSMVLYWLIDFDRWKEKLLV